MGLRQRFFDWVAGKAAPTPGGAPAYALGLPYGDVYRKDRAPTPTELVQELVGTAYSCAMLNADLMASTPLRLYVRTRRGEARSKLLDRGAAVPVAKKAVARLKADPANTRYVAGDDDVAEVLDHPVLDLLRGEDETQQTINQFDLFHTSQLYQESVGRAYWFIERGGLARTPTRRWLLPSHFVREVIDPATGLIQYYELANARKPTRYELDEVVVFRLPDPYNPYVGSSSPMRASIEKIRVARKQDAQINALLDNMGRPDAIFTPTGVEDGYSLLPEQVERIRTRFRQRFNMGGRGSVLIMDTPGKLDPIGWKPQDIVEIERAKMLKEDVAGCFQVPIAKLARNDANRASSETADYAHKQDAGVPQCTRNAQALNAGLLPMYPAASARGRLFFAYDSPVPEDQESNREDAKVAAVTSAAVARVQQAYYTQQIPREAAIAQAVTVMHFTPDQAEELFPPGKAKPLQKPGGPANGDK